MFKKKRKSLLAGQSLFAASLTLPFGLSAADNPFEFKDLYRQEAMSGIGAKLAQAMCGASRQGMCGSWTEGMMMGGPMPKSADPLHLPAPESEGARLVNQYCTQCHVLPLPGQHSATGWPPVTARMNVRMQWMTHNSKLGIKAPTSDELQTITEYLREHAAQAAPDSEIPTVGAAPPPRN